MSAKLHLIMLSLICILCILAPARSAQAHSGAGSGEDLLEFIFTGLTSTVQAITGIAAGISADLSTSTQFPVGSVFFGKAKGERAPLATEYLRLYMTAQQVQLLHDLSLGSGQSLDDLAVLGQVPHARRAAFGVALRRQRATLAGLLSPGDEVHTQHARRFAAQVDEILLALER